MNHKIIKEDADLEPQDHEADMARSELYKTAEYAVKLFHMIKPGENLEGWVAAKITKAADYLDSVAHYMEYQKKFKGSEESVDTVPQEGPNESVTAEIKDNLSEQWTKFKQG